MDRAEQMRAECAKLLEERADHYRREERKALDAGQRLKANSFMAKWQALDAAEDAIRELPLPPMEKHQ